jgi:hypothetical protein
VSSEFRPRQNLPNPRQLEKLKEERARLDSNPVHRTRVSPLPLDCFSVGFSLQFLPCKFRQQGFDNTVNMTRNKTCDDTCNKSSDRISLDKRQNK